MIKVLQVNVDDKNNGGVFSLIKNVIINNTKDIKMDIACIERFTNKDNVKLLKEHNCDIYYFGGDKPGLKKYKYARKSFVEFLKNNKYDYVHIHSDLAFKLLFWAKCAKKAGVKNIVVHSHASSVDGNHRTLKKFLHKVTRTKLKKVATHFVTCSNLAKQWMFPNILDENVITIKNGVNLQNFRFNKDKREEVRRDLDLTKNFVIGHVGRFSYIKNHKFLLDVFKEVYNKDKSARLLLIGEGELENELRQQVSKDNLNEVVIFYGPTNKVNEMLFAMDCFVLPSIFEGLPVVGVEAQASGLPVLFADTITREAKIIDAVKYIGIDDCCKSVWAQEILKLKDNKRFDTYEILKSQKFDISDTVKQFIDIYIK